MGHGSEPHCRLFYTDPPTCEQTYAEHYGVGYDVVQGLYIFFTLLGGMYVWKHSLALVKVKGLSWPLSNQMKIFSFSNIIMLTLIVRCVDPFNWRQIQPYTLALLAYDIATACIYAMLITMVHDWMRITFHFTPGMKQYVPIIAWIWFAVTIVTWVSWCTFSILQTTTHPWWQWHALKLGIGAVILICIIIGQTYFGWTIWRTLAAQQRRMTVSARERYSVAEDTTATTSTDSLDATVEMGDNKRGSVGSSSSGNVRERTDTQTKLMRSREAKKMKRINRILRLLGWTTLGEVIAVLFQLLGVMSDLSNKNTIQDPPDTPEGPGAVILEAVFDIVQLFGAVLAVRYFRHKPAAETDAGGSRASRSSRGSRGSGAPRPSIKYGRGARAPAASTQL